MVSKEKLVPKLRFESYVNKSYWKEHLLEDCVYQIGDGLHGTPKYVNEGNIYFINGNNLQNNKIIITDNTKRVSSEDYLKNNKNLDINTILMSINGTIGNLAFYNNEKVMLGKSVAFIKLKNLNKLYMSFYLQIPKVENYFMGRLTGSTIKNLGLETIRKTKVLIPNLNEQNKIGSFLKIIDEMIQLQQSKVNKVKDIKSAYLSEMFTNEGEKYPKKRFEGFTEPWQKRNLDSIANKFDTLRVPVTAADRIPGDIPYYGANGIQDYVEGYTHDGEYVLLAEDGANDLNDYPVHYVNGKVWVNNHAHVLQGNTQVLDNRFLMYKLKTVDMEPYLVGGGRAKLNANVMMSIEIALPSIEEQEKIGKFFKNLDNQISVEEEKLMKLEKLKLAYLNDMFV